jgi:hypothetical protein
MEWPAHFFQFPESTVVAFYAQYPAHTNATTFSFFVFFVYFCSHYSSLISVNQ